MPLSSIKSTAGTQPHFPVDLSCDDKWRPHHSFRRRGDVFRKGNQFPFHVLDFNTVVNFSKVLRSCCSSSPGHWLIPFSSLQESRQKQLHRQIPTDHVLQQRGYGQHIPTDSDETHLNAESSEQLLLSSPRHTMSQRKHKKRQVLNYLWKDEQYFLLSTLHFGSDLPKPNYSQKRQL